MRTLRTSLPFSARASVALLLALLFGYSFSLTFAQTSSGDVVFRGNARTGAYSAVPVRATPHVVWEYQLPRNSLFAAPVVSGDALYLTGQDGVLHVLNRHTLQSLWTFRPGSGALIHAAPVVAGGTVYVTTERGLYALDTATGSQRWSFTANSIIFGSPALAEGVIYFAIQDGTMFALDAASGQEKWRFAGAGNTHDPIALSDGILYFVRYPVLYAVDAATGSEKWQVDKGSGFGWFGVAMANGVVYAPSDNGNLYAFDAQTGSELWSTPHGAQPSSPPAVADGIVYSGDQANRLHAFDAQTGSELWTFEADDWPSYPSVAAGVLYVGTTNHVNRDGPRNLYALDARTGAELWRFRADSRLFAPPAFADNILYLQSWFGKVYALSDTIPPLPSPTSAPTQAPTISVPTDGIPGSGSRAFPETGKTVNGIFLDYWNSHGGLAQQGYPISEVMSEVSDLDGKTYTVQYFERAVFEYHPENEPPYNVLLSQLGTFQYRSKYPQGAPNQQPDGSVGSRLFPETGYRVGGKFLDYWEAHGGLSQQGYPISDAFQEKSNLDGKTYTVQYFERAVFELHPENAGTAYEVLLSQLGTFQYEARYGDR